ncbi:MAG: SUMF1/EgtB/PvdO family nonheme iron enzyme, partial [Polyangiaceae bacterium]
VGAIGGSIYGMMHRNAPATLDVVTATSASAPGSTDDAAVAMSVSGNLDSGACPTGMVPIPGGQFFLGSDDGEPAEKPAHAVVLRPYCIDRYEVSVAQYIDCSERGHCKRASSTNEWDGITAKERETYDPLCNIRQPATRSTHPVNCVTWEMSAIFCHDIGKRLPTEAEWEFAARGSDGRKYPWGDDAPTGGHLNACGPECVAWGKEHGVSFTAMYDVNDHFPNTSPVGSFPAGASRFGVEDVVGNVWEWVNDWYGPYKAGKIGEPEHDPKGPPDGKQRVIRGGAWNSENPNWLRPSFRYRDTPGKESFGIGFRCAK